MSWDIGLSRCLSPEAEFLPVAVDDYLSVYEEVLHALPARLGGGPEFQVLQAIVQPVSVDVMDVLVAAKGSTQVSGHYQSVLGHA